ncbi:hypothetical protein EHS43_30060 [Streptomyces sp. RP5T]|nr:hypothetical protein EHS43_30060 [Streptomyces sp. RP5T]
MTAPDSLPLHALAEDNLAAASPDLLRAMVKTFADALKRRSVSRSAGHHPSPRRTRRRPRPRRSGCSSR